MRRALNPPISAAGKAQRRHRGETEGERTVRKKERKGGTTWTRTSPFVDV